MSDFGVLEGDPVAIDGRRARRERGRLAVIDAMVDLVREGHTPPSVDLVAERAGVSVSSIFRYFQGLDDLQRQTTERFFERYAPLFEIAEPGLGPLEDRIDRFVRSRIALYATTAPIARLARARALDHPPLATALGGMRQRLIGQVRDHFGPEVDAAGRAAGRDLVGAIVTLTSFEAWDQLRGDLDVSATAVRRAWTSALRALCAPPLR